MLQALSRKLDYFSKSRFEMGLKFSGFMDSLKFASPEKYSIFPFKMEKSGSPKFVENEVEKSLCCLFCEYFVSKTRLIKALSLFRHRMSKHSSSQIYTTFF